MRSGARRLQAALAEYCQRASPRRRRASTALLIIGAISGIAALGTAYTIGVAIAPFSAAALATGGGLYPTAIRLPWSILGAIVLIGWVVGIALL